MWPLTWAPSEPRPSNDVPKRRTCKCFPPGAIKTWFGSSRSPWTASLMDNSPSESSRQASDLVKLGGMCCTTTIGGIGGRSDSNKRQGGRTARRNPNRNALVGQFARVLGTAAFFGGGPLAARLLRAPLLPLPPDFQNPPHVGAGRRRILRGKSSRNADRVLAP